MQQKKLRMPLYKFEALALRMSEKGPNFWEIADALKTSYENVRLHLQHAAAKIGTQFISEAVSCWIEQGRPEGKEFQAAKFEGSTLLTLREQEIIFLIFKRGYSNREIHEVLFISKQTIRNYLNSIFKKFEKAYENRPHDRLEAAQIAVMHGLVSPEAESVYYFLLTAEERSEATA